MTMFGMKDSSEMCICAGCFCLRILYNAIICINKINKNVSVYPCHIGFVLHVLLLPVWVWVLFCFVLLLVPVTVIYLCTPSPPPPLTHKHTCTQTLSLRKLFLINQSDGSLKNKILNNMF